MNDMKIEKKIIWIILLSIFLFSASITSVAADDELLIRLKQKGYLDDSFLSSLDLSLLYEDELGVIFYKHFLLLYPEYCKNINYIVPEHVTVIAAGAFAYNYYLQNITVGNNVLVIESAAFQYCTALNTIKLPENLYYIGSAAFANCKSLKNVFIPNSVRIIGIQAFCESGLECHIILPENIEYLGDEAFAQTYVPSIELPAHDFAVGIWVITEPFIIYAPEGYTITASFIAESSSGVIIVK